MKAPTLVALNQRMVSHRAPAKAKRPQLLPRGELAKRTKSRLAESRQRRTIMTVLVIKDSRARTELPAVIQAPASRTQQVSLSNHAVVFDAMQVTG